MEMVSGMRRQIIMHLRNLGFVRSHGAGDIRDLNTNSRNWAVIKAVVGAGLYPNIMQVILCRLILKNKELVIYFWQVLSKNQKVLFIFSKDTKREKWFYFIKISVDIKGSSVSRILLTLWTREPIRFDVTWDLFYS